MKSCHSIYKKTPLIIGLGMILGLNSVDLLAVESAEQVVQSEQSGQIKKTKTAKKTRKLKKSAAAINPADTTELTIQPAGQTVPAPQPKKTAESKQPESAKKTAKTEKPEELGEIRINAGRSRNLLGMTDSASQGVISQEQIEFRSIARVGEVLELIPGMIATQHSGSGKANQYFLRGYNLDHGTDFTTILDGIPMNLPTHAHGQGYMDLNSVIPELVEKIDYGKGPYYAEIGDFSAAGFNKMTTMKTLPKGFAKLTGGEFNFYRAVAANSSQVGEGNLLYAGEFQYYDGPWAVPENSHKYNGILRYTQDHENWGMAVNAKAYTNRWTATNQIAQYAIDSGQLGLYGSLSPSDAANTNRYTFSTNVWNKGNDWKNDANLYAVYYDLDMYSNFTGYLNGPWGDQMNQKEHRVQVGGSEEFTHYDKLFGLDMDNTYGMNFQHNEITVGLNETVNRQYLNTMSLNDVSESTGGLFFKNQIHWNEKFRTVQALRADLITMQVTELANGYTNGNAAVTGAAASSFTAYAPSLAAGQIEAADPALAAQINAANSGYQSKEMLSPKFSAIMGPWYKTEYYFNAGYGYHSNDARGTVATLNPDNQFAPGTTTLTNPLTTAADGSTMKPVTPMAWMRGAEIGLRSNIIPRLNTTLTTWWSQSSSELIFDGDSGTTTVNGMSDRYGLEFTNYYKATDWLTLDFDLSKSDGRFEHTPPTINGSCTTANPDAPCSGRYITNLVGTVIAAGAQVVAPNGMYGSLRLRHFGDSPLDTNGAFWAAPVDILNLGVGYKQKTYKIDFSIFNLLGETTSDVAYAYQYSANPADQNGTYGIVRHPVQPRMGRISFTLYF